MSRSDTFRSASALIVGAGVAGLSTALKLLLRGYKVELLDRGEVGSESSWSGGGILSPLLPWEYDMPVSTLAFRSMSIYSDWVKTIEQESQLSAEYWSCGMRVLEPRDNPTTLGWCLENGLTAVPTIKGLWLPDIAQIRNPRLIEALRVALHNRGGTIRTACEVTSVTKTKARLIAVHTASGAFTADNYVFATGAWSAISLPNTDSVSTQEVSGCPAIRPIRGQMLLFKLEPGVLNTIVYRNGLYLIPRLDGHVLVGSTLEDVGFDKSVDVATRVRLHKEAAELLPALATVQPIRHWAGLRPGSPDNIPIIGRHPDFDNVFFNTGHYRYGVTMAPASAELLVDLMEGKTPALDPTPYSWEAALARKWGDKL